MTIPTFQILKWAAALFFPVAILIVSITSYTHQNQVDAKLETLLIQEQKIIASQHLAIANIFETIISDIEILSLHSDLIALLSAQDSQTFKRHQKELSQEFLAFITHKKVFDQLRVINKDGWELVRVEQFKNTVRLVPQEQLQNKKPRFYFKTAITSPPNTIHVAAINLNIEQGQVEIPHKPVSQISMSLGSHDGITRGVLVLNYLAGNLFNIIDNLASSSEGSMQLLNTNGFWIKAPQEKNQWGHIIKTRKDRAFSIDYADAWQQITQAKSGQFINAQGLFTFTKIQQLATTEDQGHAHLSLAKNNEWVVLSFIPASKLDKITAYQGKLTLLNDLTILLIWFIFSLLFARNRLQHRADENLIEERDARIRDIVDTAFDCIITIDEKGIISSFNPAACKMFGYQEAEIIGENISLIVPSPHKEQHDDYLTRYINTREEHIIKKPREVEGLKKDGSIFPIELCVGAKEMGKHWMFTGIIRDITERKELTAKLEKMATTDALTGLYNRGYFNTKIDQEFKRAQRYKSELSLMIMDLDHFKSVNDDYGHPAGDAVLIACAQILTQSVRDIDIVARYGGEEFVIIMPETAIESAQVIAERIRQAIETMRVSFEEHIIHRTTSIGLVSLSHSDAETPDSLLIMADSALYKAKESGRNQIVLHENH
ncbi:MAG: diguanylate cyclase [Mariprofundaceae bacterium]